MGVCGKMAGKRVTVVGLARSGVAAANLLVRMGAEVTGTDLKPAEALEPGTRQLDRSVRLELGGHRPELFLQSDLIVVSPGVPLTLPALEQAAAKGVRIIGELELAHTVCEAPIIAISGTNGKSTTTTLIGELFRRAGKRVFVGGNLGDALAGSVGTGREGECVIAEVSSFQLETVETFRPRVAVMLNLTADHLDRHGSFEAYRAIKLRLFARQTMDDWAVLNLDDPEVAAMARELRARCAYFSCHTRPSTGVYLRDGLFMWRVAGVERPVCSLASVRLEGKHNLENVCAALTVGAIWGLPEDAMEEAIASMTGLEHRMEFVRELSGVRYYNDSKGTNVGATIKSIESLTAPIILILGGKDKASDFTPLRRLVLERVKTTLLLGQAAGRIRQALDGVPEVRTVGSLEEAVAQAGARSLPGDVVLLSPACASFDMFRDFEDRGRRFKEFVSRLG